MNGLFVLFLCMMIGSMALLFLSQTEWARDHARWLTKLWCFVVLGLILGAGMLGICYLAAAGIAEWMKSAN